VARDALGEAALRHGDAERQDADQKYGTGLAKPWSASRKLFVAPVSASSVTPSSAAAPESSQRVVQRTMVISVTRSARWPESERPWKSGGSKSVSPSAP
jgi:hypothetical protein